MRSILLLSCALLLSCQADTDGGEEATGDRTEVVGEIVDTSKIVGGLDGTSGVITEDATYILTLENLHDTFGDEGRMIAKFGEANVVRGEMHVGEGETVPATILHPDDPTRRVEVTWLDLPSRAFPNVVRIAGDNSLWRLEPGLRPGITLKELEALNGGPFTMLGFEWDYAGRVTDWKGGTIGRMESEEVSISVSLMPSEEDYATIGHDRMSHLLGDQEVGSDDPVMQEVNPRVRVVEIVWAE